MSIPQEKMRRLAHRATNVLDRVKERSMVLSAFGETFLPLAERYIELYDAGRTLRQANRREGAEGRDAIDTLASATRSWSYLVRTKAPNYQHRDFGDSSGVPEDVIADAKGFLIAVDEIAVGGVSLPFLETLRADLSARLEVATKEWSEATDAIATLRDHQGEIRQLHEHLQADLVSLRRVLAMELGTAHPDYQKLRLSRSGAPDPDDDLAIEPGDPAGDEIDALEGPFEAAMGEPAATSAVDESGALSPEPALLQAIESA